MDKDLTAALLARANSMLTSLCCSQTCPVSRSDFGTESAKVIRRTTPKALREMDFPAGSMGPKVEAVCRFVEATGKQAMIGRLEDALS